jgi:hypothetical protein
MYQVNVEDIKCPLEWWNKHEFSIIDFLFKHILGIIGSNENTLQCKQL